MYLLDTCVFSETQKPRPDERVLGWFRDQHDHDLFASALTIGEIRRGIARLAPSASRRRLESWVNNTLVPGLEDRILPTGLEVALAWGDLCGESERRGRTLPVLDSLIAATALVHGLAVVTRNGADFEECGVRVVNPWAGGV